jgi:CubicO group peptidase (beta-lactamase class C family)
MGEGDTRTRAAVDRARRRSPATLAAAIAALLLLPLLLVPIIVLWLPASRQDEEAPREGLAPRGFPLEAIDSAATLMRREVAERAFPGAVLAAGIGPFRLALTGVGRLEWSPTSPPVSPDSTEYDLASLSKAVATTSAVLLLVQDGRIRLDDPVRRWLPEFYGRWKEEVTWRHLLTHTSGLPPAGHMSGDTPAERLAGLMRTRLDTPPGTEVQYSDVGYIVLWAAAQRAAGEPLPRFLERRIWRPLGMRHTGYLPGLGCTTCAPTLMLSDGQPFRGKPSDPMARALGGIAGNAGLFSSATDLGRFAAMVASGGSLNGVRIFRDDIARGLLTQQPHAGRRTLGWDTFCPAEEAVASVPCRHPVAYGHFGWTGTSLWVDPARRLWVVLLANRSYDVLHPKSMQAVRVGVFATLAGERLDTAAAAPRTTGTAPAADATRASSRPAGALATAPPARARPAARAHARAHGRTPRTALAKARRGERKRAAAPGHTTRDARAHHRAHGRARARPRA